MLSEVRAHYKEFLNSMKFVKELSLKGTENHRTELLYVSVSTYRVVEKTLTG